MPVLLEPGGRIPNNFDLLTFVIPANGGAPSGESVAACGCGNGYRFAKRQGKPNSAISL
jgi:hypothetical protein